MRRFNSARLLIILAAGTSACETPSDVADQDPAARLASGGALDAYPAEREFRAIAREFPAFGGYFFDEEGNLVVSMKGGGPHADIQARLGERLHDFRARLPEPLKAQRSHGRVLVRPAAFTFEELADFRERLGGALSQIDGLVFLDLDETKNRLTFGISEASARGRIESLAAQLGVPPATLAFAASGPIVRDIGRERDIPLQQSTQFQTLWSTLRPLRGGVVTHWRKGDGSTTWCTLGFVAQGNHSPHPGALVNSHCSDTEWGLDRYVNYYYQSEDVPLNLLGTEDSDPPGYWCYFFWKCRLSDAAWVSMPGVDAGRGLIARTTSLGMLGEEGSQVINANDPVFKIVQERTPVSGEPVEKVGARTGWTLGLIRHTCVDSWGSDGMAHKRGCQHYASYYAYFGDSGSPVFGLADGQTESPLEVHLFGIHWGRTADEQYSIFSPITNIKQDHAGYTSFTTVHPPPLPALSVWLNGDTSPPPNTMQTWTAVPMNGTAPYAYQWLREGTWVSSEASYTASSGVAAFTLSVSVTDALGRTASNQWLIQPECTPGPVECPN
ncbi:MAG TPA: hypothetical protein VFQ45_06225 [Longimicrobium sp.]|nr:hypothetical protein [Longimicrobium sp.]